MYSTINFSRGIPDPASFPVEELEEMTQIALRNHAGTMLQYGPAYGYAPLREFLASWFKCSPANVLVGNGSLEIFSFLCEALLRPGDTVFVESPTYDRALTTLRQHNIRIVGIEVGPEGVEPAALEEALREHTPKFFYVIPDFQNPTGASTSLAVRRRIAELASQKNFLIVEDGPYGFLRYAGRKIESIYSMAPLHTVHLSSFTKLISPGVRTGFMLGEPILVQKVARIAERHYISPGYFAQGVVAEWCDRGYLQKQLKRLRALYAPRLNCAVDAINAHLPGRLFVKPEGGFFLGLKLDPDIAESMLLAVAAERGLVLSSGNSFFADAPAYRFLRLPFCALSPDEIRLGIERLAEVVGVIEQTV
jgi:DNA-binding transcriptional MocR family regulator